MEKLGDQKFETNALKELETKRFKEAKTRLRNFLVNTDMGPSDERERLFKYFGHRYSSLVQNLKDSFRARKLSKFKSTAKAELVTT